MPAAPTGTEPARGRRNGSDAMPLGQQLVAALPEALRKLSPVHLYRSPEQHRNWLDSIRSRQPNIATAELGHRACSTCLVHGIAMHLPDQRLKWDPVAECFIGNDEANARLSRPVRKGYAI